MVLESRYGALDLSFTIRQGMDSIVTAALLRSHLFENLVRLLLQRAAPRRVVVAPDRAPEALTVIRQCRALDIPTWSIQTVYHSRHPRYKALQADFTSLIDTWSFSLFRDHFGIDPRRLFVTGSPRMRFKIADDQPTPTKQLLFICQRGVPFNLANLDYVLRNLVEFADYDLLVRPHPSETSHQVRSYQTLLARYPQQRASIDPARPLREVMLAASVVLVAYSNVGLEAACYGIPVLVINPSGIDYPVAMDEMGIGFPVNTDQELRCALRGLRDDGDFSRQLAQAQRHYLDSNAHLLEGDPVERIVALIVAGNPGMTLAPPKPTPTQAPMVSNG
jgi:CDP-glycerol glycerophosphotransferase (TagB/SpsB family)